MSWKNVQYENGKLRTNNGGGGASQLSDLSDVNITSVSNGQVLKYNALSSKWINANESGGSSSHYYSTTEQEIGTWIDGRPVYELTVDFGSGGLSVANSSWVETSVLWDDKSIIIDGRLIDNSGQLFICVGVGTSNQKVAVYAITGRTRTMRYFIVQYIKSASWKGGILHA